MSHINTLIANLEQLRTDRPNEFLNDLATALNAMHVEITITEGGCCLHSRGLVSTMTLAFKKDDATEPTTNDNNTTPEDNNPKPKKDEDDTAMTKTFIYVKVLRLYLQR